MNVSEDSSFDESVKNRERVILTCAEAQERETGSGVYRALAIYEPARAVFLSISAWSL